ncbi:universal stress protein [Mycobacterium sp.]|uniref:universal stress protein n=1 Tax=Mycobacterium sp. TaxID=1785 RepID=UPI002B74403B|nr:universal stress protein [Mycobacterium sp.]HTQ21862.1 universal stress protein [Mycobacterium sp.]
MSHPQAPKRVVVGIDGSEAAINAAKWAVSEAISRDVPLRLVHAIPEPRPDAPADDDSLDIEYGETALRAATAALHAMGEQVKVETDIVHGSSDSVLVDESRHAAMVCIGTIGIGQVARKFLGSTAASVAKGARCPVAVIRDNREAEKSPSREWIAVAVGDSPGNDMVLDYGFKEAQLRKAPILAMGVWRWGLGEIPYRQLDHRLGRWVSQFPDVHVLPAAARHGVAEFLTSTKESVQLAVVGRSDSGKVARMVGPINPHFGHAGCSVLVVRD